MFRKIMRCPECEEVKIFSIGTTLNSIICDECMNEKTHNLCLTEISFDSVVTNCLNKISRAL